MASTIQQAFAQTIVNGLRRRSIVDCYAWAKKFRMMGKPFPGPYTAKYFPWAIEMHNERGDWCCKKSSQVGVTEIALNIALYTIDILRVDVLYLLPTQTPDASNFSASRFASALEMSDYLALLFSHTDNVGHKRAGATNLFIRGTRSTNALKSVPAGLMIYDELDEMTQKHLALAEQRQSGQLYHQSIKLSTPTIGDTGIAFEFNQSTKEFFAFKCPGCGRHTNLSIDGIVEQKGKVNLVIVGEDQYDPRISESYFQCRECETKLPHETKSDWLSGGMFVKTKFDGRTRGFGLNGLYSSASLRSAPAIAEKVCAARTDPTAEQEVYNSIFGQEHEVKGARISHEEFATCRKDYKMNPMISPGSIITIGCDQGSKLNFEVDQWFPYQGTTYLDDVNLRYRPKLIEAGVKAEFSELERLILKWLPKAMVIDANPETRLAIELAIRFPGIVYLCYYGEGPKGRNLVLWNNEPKVTVDRTSWLDLSLGRFRGDKPSIMLPADIPDEYYRQIAAPVRMPDRDRNGNPIARYVTKERVADHYAHSRNYAEIALQFALGTPMIENTESPR